MGEIGHVSRLKTRKRRGGATNTARPVTNPDRATRRTEEERGDMLFVPDDDKQARSKARSAPAMFAPPICRRSRRNASRAELVL
jgi:hypothetical protein